MATASETRVIPNLVGGAWVDSRSQQTMPIPDPATGERIAEIAAAGVEDVIAAVQAASSAFADGRWSGLTPAQRDPHPAG